MSAFKEAAELQEAFVHAKTKKAMCDLCVPFRDKYDLTDLQTLQIARKEMSLSEMVTLLEKPSKIKLWQFCLWLDDYSCIAGVFKATDDEVANLTGKKFHLDEVGIPFATPMLIEPDTIILISDDPYVVEAMSEVGYNPFDYVR